jgi:hypothetical protein
LYVLPTLVPTYINARADECVAIAQGCGERIVQCRGGEYTVIGYYLASHAGERVLCYILRAPSRTDGSRRRTNNGALYAPAGDDHEH